jgi:hypothetical protein
MGSKSVKTSLQIGVSIARPSVSHDVANSACGALLAAQDHGDAVSPHHLQAYGIGSSHDPLATPEENAIALAREQARAGYFSGPGWAPTWVGDDDRTHQNYGID